MIERWSKERIRYILLILAVSILPVLLFGLVAINYSSTIAQKEAEKVDKIIISNLSNQTYFFIARAQDIVQSLAHLPIGKIEKETLESVYRNNTFRDFYIFESFILLDEKGGVKMLYPERKEFLGLDYSRQPSFRNVKEKEKIFFSGVEFSSVSGQPVIVIAAPIFQPGFPKTLVGVLQASIRLQGLSSLIKEFGTNEKTALAFLIGQYGEIIAHPDYRLVKQRENIANAYPLLNDEILKQEKTEGTFQYSSREKVEYLVNFQTVYPTDWKLIVRQEIKEVLVTPLQLRSFLLITLISTLIIAGGASYNVASFLGRITKEREKTRDERDKEFREKIEALEKFQTVTVGRELRMIELKKTIKELEERLKTSKDSPPQNNNG